MSAYGLVPRFGTEPKLGEKSLSSEVIFSSRMLLVGASGLGRADELADILLSGRKMVLNS